MTASKKVKISIASHFFHWRAIGGLGYTKERFRIQFLQSPNYILFGSQTSYNPPYLLPKFQKFWMFVGAPMESLCRLGILTRPDARLEE